MTTREAFEKLISERSVHKKLGIESMQIRTYRNRIKNHNQYPSIELMMELLQKGGFTLLHEMKWKDS